MLPSHVDELSGSDVEREGHASSSTDTHNMDPDDVTGKKKALEIFAGDGNLSAAINCYRGMKCWSKDIKRSALEDITLPQEEKMICDAIDSKFLDYIHFAPPCHQFSSARWPKLRTAARLILMLSVAELVSPREEPSF